MGVRQSPAHALAKEGDRCPARRRAEREQRLRYLEVCLAIGREQIEKQHELIAVLQARGADTERAVKLLEILTEMQVEMSAEAQRLGGELADSIPLSDASL